MRAYRIVLGCLGLACLALAANVWANESDVSDVVILPPLEIFVPDTEVPQFPLPFPDSPEPPRAAPNAVPKKTPALTLPDEKPAPRSAFPKDLSGFSEPAKNGLRAAPAPRQQPLEGLVQDPIEFVVAGDHTLRIPSRFSLRHDVGHGVGYRNGFTYIEGFIPFWQPGNDAIGFGDVRAVNFDDASRWEFNAGGGYRSYRPCLDAVLGVNTFYDGRWDWGNYYQQIGVGFEALGEFLEFRCNGYYVVGSARQAISSSTTKVASGPNFIVTQQQVYGAALSGFESEVGGPLPGLERWYPRVYAGYYHYSGEGVPTLNGIRGRLEAQLARQVSLHFAVQNDRVFDTTVSGGLAIHFGAPAFRWGRGGPSIEDILGQRVVRDVNIVLDTTTTTTTQFIPGAPAPPKEKECEEQECER